MQEPALTGLCSRKQAGRPRVPRIIGKARIQRRMSAHEDPWQRRDLDVHPTAHRPDCLTGHAWLQLPDRICEVHRGLLEFWYDPPGCALTDEELALLRRVATAGEPVLFQADDGSVATHRAFDRRVDTLRELRQAGWIVRETWAAGPGQRGHPRRRYTAAQASITESGREGWS